MIVIFQLHWLTNEKLHFRASRGWRYPKFISLLSPPSVGRRHAGNLLQIISPAGSTLVQ